MKIQSGCGPEDRSLSRPGKFPVLKKMAETRKSVRYSGRVQGVGFRYTAVRIAGQYRVTGFVRNLPDGGVELVTEGEEDEINGLLESIKETLDRNIRDANVQDHAATGEFHSFDIRFQD